MGDVRGNTYVLYQASANRMQSCTDSPEGVEDMKKKGVLIKEGAKFKFRISFRVQVGARKGGFCLLLVDLRWLTFSPLRMVVILLLEME